MQPCAYSLGRAVLEAVQLSSAEFICPCVAFTRQVCHEQLDAVPWKLPSGSAVLHSFSVCASAAALSDAAGRQNVHCCAPRPRCAVIASASCASVSKQAMYLCGVSESCGQTARISDACQCSANPAHLLAVTIQPPIPMRSPSARASAAAKQCSSGF